MATKASFYDRVTEQVDLDEENYVILQVPTYGEMQAVMKQAMKVSMGTNGDPSADIDIFEMEIASIVACVKSWGGPGFAGNKPNRGTILGLPQTVIEQIKPHVDRMTSNKKGKDAEESKKNSDDTMSNG